MLQSPPAKKQRLVEQSHLKQHQDNERCIQKYEMNYYELKKQRSNLLIDGYIRKQYLLNKNKNCSNYSIIMNIFPSDVKNMVINYNPLSVKCYAIGNNWTSQLAIDGTTAVVNQLTECELIESTLQNTKKIIPCVGYGFALINKGNELFVWGNNYRNIWKLSEHELSSLSHHDTIVKPHKIDMHTLLLDGNDQGNISITNMSSTHGDARHAFIICENKPNNKMINQMIYGYGLYEHGQLGIGNYNENDIIKQMIDNNIPLLVNIENNEIIENIKCGASHSMFLSKNNHRLYSCGWNAYGQCGVIDNDDDSCTQAIYTPTRIEFDDDKNIDVMLMDCGAFHSICLDNKGSIWVFGTNCRGQLGINDPNIKYSKKPICLINIINDKIKFIACGANYNIGLDEHYNLCFWGSCAQQIYYSPLLLRNTSSMDININIYCGSGHLLLMEPNDLYSMGANNGGQCLHDHNSVNQLENLSKIENKRIKKIIDNNEIIIDVIVGNECTLFVTLHHEINISAWTMWDSGPFW
jgi:alpha-tubulin suppressor-like RCC1 family protein